MHGRIRTWTVAVAATGAAALALSACGSDDSSSSSSTSTASSGAAAKGAKSVCLVTDVGGLNDRGFNQLAYQGLKRAKTELGVSTRVLSSNSDADYLPNLVSCARQKSDLIVAVGFQLTEAVEKTAKQFPKVDFGIIDVEENKVPNVEGVVFRASQSGYLAGVLAGLVAKEQGGKQQVSSVAAQSLPPIDEYLAGYQAGVKKANPSATVTNTYSQTFTDQAKCKQLALNQIAAGSQVVFAVAGPCGAGVYDAAKQRGVKAIAVDADQAYVGSQVASSALKRVDVAVLSLAKQVVDGAFKGGQTQTLGIDTGATGLGKIQSVPDSVVKGVEAAEADLKAGKVNVPTTLQK